QIVLSRHNTRPDHYASCRCPPKLAEPRYCLDHGCPKIHFSPNPYVRHKRRTKKRKVCPYPFPLVKGSIYLRPLPHFLPNFHRSDQIHYEVDLPYAIYRPAPCNTPYPSV